VNYKNLRPKFKHIDIYVTHLKSRGVENEQILDMVNAKFNNKNLEVSHAR
jgi:hypothetical protein